MDLLIPLGTGSKWKDNELRYCLRGLEMYCQDLDRVIISGEKPDWIQNIIHVPCKDAHSPTLSIWNKTLAGSKETDEFLFCNDDYFFLKSFIAAEYPNYYTDVTGNSPYKRILRRTIKVCEQSGLSEYNYDVHKPMRFNSAKFQETYKYFSWHLPIDQGLLMKSCYGNLHNIGGEYCNDLKPFHGCEIKDVDMFSISDEFLDRSFKNLCEVRWPLKSKYEK
jgi:hypothetical protein